jgi:hypothetical protein
MTETTTTTPPDAAIGSDLPLDPPDILLNLIVAFLAPMFLSVCGSNINYARMAAIESVNAYRARNHADLIAIAQIIAFGLAAMASLSQSMADDIALSMALRLRGNANALNRAAEQNRRVLNESRIADQAETAAEPVAMTALADDDLNDVEQAAGIVSAQQSATHAQTGLQTEKQTRTLAPAVTPASIAAARMTAEKRHQAMWAIAMVKEAQEITASIPSLPPAERRAASIRAGALSCTANELLTGASSPPPIHRGQDAIGRPTTI